MSGRRVNASHPNHDRLLVSVVLFKLRTKTFHRKIKNKNIIKNCKVKGTAPTDRHITLAITSLKKGQWFS